MSSLTSYTRGATTSYGWQAVPNRNSVTAGGNTVTTTFDAANRPLADTPGGSYASDLEGRLTARPGQILIWDDLGRLTQVKDASTQAVIAAYSYDALDRLLVVTPQTGSAYRFRYVGLTTEVAQTVDVSSGTVLRSFANDWHGERLVDWTGTGSDQHFYGTNAHHDVTWTANDTGAVVSTLRYDPWGNLTVSYGSYLPAFRFQGSWFDPSVELSWVVARWYAPQLGRFISEDSVAGDMAVPPSRHLYAFAGGEPVDRWDPQGTYWHLIRRFVTNVTTEASFLGVTPRDLAAANPGRITDLSLRTTSPLHNGDCIWVPFRNGRHECNAGDGDSPMYVAGMYQRFYKIANDMLGKMLDRSKDGAGGVGQWWTDDLACWFVPGCPATVAAHNASLLAAWAYQVAPRGRCTPFGFDLGCGKWDDKPYLTHTYFGGRLFWTAVPGDPAPEVLTFDVWSNLAYGYAGRAHGIPLRTLLDGALAGAVLAGGDITQELGDSIAIMTGANLWDSYGRSLTVLQLTRAISAGMPSFRRDSWYVQYPLQPIIGSDDVRKYR